LGNYPIVQQPAAWATLTLVLVGVYHVLRYTAARCVGSGCDAYIPVSALVPLVTWFAAVVTSVVALLHARRAAHQTAWTVTLGAATVLAVSGPPVALFVLRDSPDLFVLVGTAVLVLVPVTVLLYVAAGN
jgi:hypothetical protein